MKLSPHGNIAIITGSADGIGEAVALLLARNKFKVAIVDLDKNKAETAAIRLREETGANVIAVAADVSDQISSERAYKTILKDFGEPTVLVNNAGIMPQSISQIETQKITDFEKMIAIHVHGTFIWSQMAVKSMRLKKFGRIINVSSVLGLLAIPYRLGYSTAKTAIIGFTRSLAVETARFGITVNAVAPGYVLTKTLKKRIEGGLLDHNIIADKTPIGRWAQPDEVASLILFLVGDKAGYITGTTIPIDGGFHIRGDIGDNIN